MFLAASSLSKAWDIAISICPNPNQGGIGHHHGVINVATMSPLISACPHPPILEIMACNDNNKWNKSVVTTMAKVRRILAAVPFKTSF